MDLDPALAMLKARRVDVGRCELPADRGPRTVIRLKPDKPTPKIYPRAVGIPGKQPLGAQADDNRS